MSKNRSVTYAGRGTHKIRALPRQAHWSYGDRMDSFCPHVRMNLIYGFFVFLLQFVSISHSPTHSLSASTILLPRTSRGSEQVVYDLSVSGEDGCFRVFNTRDEVVSVMTRDATFDTKLSTRCVRSMRLVAVSQLPSREGTVITFNDVITGLTLKTQLFVDTVVRLEIVTRRRVLFIGDVKERIEAIAYDNSGNVFSSLNGALFEWKLSCGISCKNRLPVSFATFQSSNYEADDVVSGVEARGARTNVVLLESLFVGEVVLSARMLDPLYSHISAQVRLMVRENVVLEPDTEQYLIRGAFQSFRAFRILRGKRDEVRIHPKTYELSVSDVNVTKIHSDMKTVLGVNVGRSTVSLLEKNEFSKELDPFQITVHVVDPTHLTVLSEGQQNWVLELNHNYTFSLQFHYFDRILNTSQLVFDTNISLSNDKVVPVLNETTRQSFSVHTKSLGVVELTVSLASFTTFFKTTAFLFNPLSATIQIEVVDSISLSPSLIVGPFLKQSVLHLYSFNASGGTGRYVWESLPNNLFSDAFSSEFGAPNVSGEYEITCRDRANRFIFGNGTFMYLPVVKMELSSEFSDAPIGSPLAVNVRLLGMLPSSDELINITHVPSNIIGLHFSDPLIFTACEKRFFSSTSFCVVAAAPGCTTATVNLINSTINSSLRLCAFLPLKVVSRTQYAIPGSFITVVLSGGPLSVQPRRHKQELKTSLNNNTFVTVATNTSEDSLNRTESVRFQCLRPGNSEVSFTSEYPPVTAFPKPYKSVLKYYLMCLEPEGLILKVKSFDSKHRCTTRPYVCGTSKCGIAFSLYTYNRFLISDLSGFVHTFHSLPFRSLSSSGVYLASSTVLGTSGSLIVRPFRSTGLSKLLVHFRPALATYSFSLTFFLNVVPHLRIFSYRLAILNYELNSRDVKISGGSGNFEVNLPNPIVFINQAGALLHIRPLRPGFSVVTVRDQCTMSPPLKLEVFVTTVKRVSVSYPSKTLTNKSLRANVVVYNDINEIVPNEEQHLLNIRFRFMEREPDEVLKSLNDRSNRAAYDLYSSSPRLVDFIVEVTLIKNATIVSDKCRFEVFDSVRVIPSSLNMVPGMEVVVKTVGGPVLDAYTRFSVSDECLVFFECNNTLFARRPCRAILAVTVHPADSDQELVYSHFEVPVTVSYVSRVEIDAVGVKFYQFTKIPASLLIYNAHGLVSPYLSLSNDYTINWSVDKPAHMEPRFYGNSMTEDKLVLLMLKEGSASVDVSFADNHSSKVRRFSATKLLYILRSLNIFSCYNRLLLPPSVSMDLKERYVSVHASFHFIDPLHLGFSIDSANVLTVSGYPATELVAAEVRDSREDVIHREIIPFLVEVAEVAAVFFFPNEDGPSLGRLPVGQSLSLQVLAIDHLGRQFNFVTPSSINISLTPPGVIEFVEFKDMTLTLKGLSLGKAYIHLHISSGKAWIYKIVVDNPFTFTSLSLSLGGLAFFSLPSAADEWLMTDENVLSVSSPVSGSLYLMGFSVGECLLQVKSRGVFYDVLRVNVKTPSNLSFASETLSTVTDRTASYYFDLAVDGVPLLNSPPYPEFSSFPFVCNLYGYRRGAFNLKPTFNAETGSVSCLLGLKPVCTDEPCQGVLELRLEVVFRGEQSAESALTASKIISFYPKLTVQPSESTLFIVDRCVFDGISLSRLESGESLSIKSTLDCIKSSYVVEDDDSVVIVIRLNRCYGIVKSDKNESLLFTRKATGQAFRLNLHLVFDNLSCLHAPFISFGLVIKLMVTACCLIVIYAYSSTVQGLLRFIHQTYIRVDARYSLAKRALGQALGVPSSSDDGALSFSPKPCSLKSAENSFGNEVDLTRELYTTRREFLNSSFL